MYFSWLYAAYRGCYILKVFFSVPVNTSSSPPPSNADRCLAGRRAFTLGRPDGRLRCKTRITCVYTVLTRSTNQPSNHRNGLRILSRSTSAAALNPLPVVCAPLMYVIAPPAETILEPRIGTMTGGQPLPVIRR